MEKPLPSFETEKIASFRTVRLKRSSLLRDKLGQIELPSFKIAEDLDELKQAFTLVYRVYLKSGYAEENASGMLYTVYHLIPETRVFIAKSFRKVISTLTQIFDHRLFGLPLDNIYRREVDKLRNEGRKVAELSSLATHETVRWRNLFMYLCRMMYWYSSYNGVQDLCITVNPKHVFFYKNIFLFEVFGPEKLHPRVKAPAVLMRLNLDDIEGKLIDIYNHLDFDCNLYDYFHRMEATGFQVTSSSRKSTLRTADIKYFIESNPHFIDGLTAECKSYLEYVYSGLKL